jgi:hypothetical protein
MANMEIAILLDEKKQADAEAKQWGIKLALWAKVKLMPAEEQMAKAIELGLIKVERVPASVPLTAPALPAPAPSLMAAGGGSSLMAAGGGSSLMAAGGGSRLMAGGGSLMAAGGGSSRTFATTASVAHTTQVEEFENLLAKIESMSTFVLSDDQIAKVLSFSRHTRNGEQLDKIRVHLSAITEEKGFEKRYSELITMLKDSPYDSNRVQKKFLAVINAAEKEAAKAEAAKAAAAKSTRSSKQFVVPDHCLLQNVGDKQMYVNGKQPVWPYKPSECKYEERTGYECSIMGCCWLAPDGNRLYLTHGGEKRPGCEPTERCWWAGEDGMQCLNGNCRKGAHFGRSKRETSLWLKFPPATSPVSGGGSDYYAEEDDYCEEEGDYEGEE